MSKLKVFLNSSHLSLPKLAWLVTGLGKRKNLTKCSNFSRRSYNNFMYLESCLENFSKHVLLWRTWEGVSTGYRVTTEGWCQEWVVKSAGKKQGGSAAWKVNADFCGLSFLFKGFNNDSDIFYT